MTAPPLGHHAPGLVVMLDHAGRTIEVLEGRVEDLVARVHVLEQANADLRHALTKATDTARVDPQEHPPTENGHHAPAVDQ